MKTKSLPQLLCALALGGWAASLAAQTMPQDTWRYNQHQFSAPDPTVTLSSIAIGKGGVYVGFFGTLTNSIGQFQENGVFIRQFGSLGGIRGIACDSAGNVYVLDAGDSTVKAFDKDGNYLRQWGGAGTNDGEFQFAVTGITTGMAIDSNDQIYVCDPGNSRVQVFDGQGSFLRKWGAPGTTPSRFPPGSPLGIAASVDGQIYVLSPYPTVFDALGNYLRTLFPQASYGVAGLVQGDVNAALAVTQDGLLLATRRTQGPYASWWLAICDAGGNNAVQLSANLFCLPNTASTLSTTSENAAFNQRGDVYAIYNNTVQINEREYSSVQNPMTPPALPLPVVLGVSQRTNTAWLDVDYQVTDADSTNVSTAALAFINGGNSLSSAVPMSTFMEGSDTNLGARVPANTKLHFTWNMGADWAIDFAQIQVEVLAKDSRHLMGFHWITVPSDGTNAAVQISSAPVPESELLSVWYWLIATHHPGIRFANGTVTGVGGAQDGQVLATSEPNNGCSTTAAGRDFAYEQMHVRAITQSEMNRANAGNYGFTATGNWDSSGHQSTSSTPVNMDSVVKLP